jgi:hypothetical protein
MGSSRRESVKTSARVAGQSVWPSTSNRVGHAWRLERQELRPSGDRRPRDAWPIYDALSLAPLPELHDLLSPRLRAVNTFSISILSASGAIPIVEILGDRQVRFVRLG